jgi:hypothetical protein
MRAEDQQRGEHVRAIGKERSEAEIRGEEMMCCLFAERKAKIDTWSSIMRDIAHLKCTSFIHVQYCKS